MEDQESILKELKELKIQNKKLTREINRIQVESDVLKEMNDKVSKTQEFFRKENQRQLFYNSQILKTSPYIMVMVDEDFKTVMASDIFFEISGVNRDVLKEGMNLTEAFSSILNDDDLEVFMKQCRYALDNETTNSYLLTSHKGGKTHIYQVDLCFYQGQTDKGISIILSDMTEIVEAKKRAENADKAKSSFLANMSHEIRTPINAVLGMNEMILREASDKSILEYSANIRAAGRTLLFLINSILDFSKIEEGKMEIIPAEYDTASVVNNLVVSVSERAKQKGLEFKVEVDPNLPCAMVGDDVRISQVIVNLLTNAVKYTETGSVCFSFSAKKREGDEITLHVAVKDTGIGIKKEDLPKLFESFERLEEERNRTIEGTGLGISIVTRLLEMMGSKLEVDSVYGEGSVFSFDIVQKVADESPIGDYSSRLADATRSIGAETLKAPDSKILVVDDNEMNLQVARNLFKLFGIIPDLVDSGFEALDRLRDGDTYHMIFLDHMMPKMDGVETLRHIKEEKLLKGDVPIIALTANAVNGAKERYLESGFDGYLSKPIEVSELERTLENFLPKELIRHEETAGKEEEEACDADKVSSLAQAGFDTQTALRFCAGDPAFYLDILSDFVKAKERNLPAIEDFFNQHNWEDYQIRVHALKSTSKQIGANELSGLAQEQEFAARDHDEATILKGAETLFKKYEEVCGLIQGTLGLGETAAAGDGGPAGDPQAAGSGDMVAILKEAKAKIEDFEAESAMEILKPISGDPRVAGGLKGVMEALDDFDNTLAEERLEELLSSLS